MKVTFEGTKEELAELFPHLVRTPAAGLEVRAATSAPSTEPIPSEEVEDEWSWVTTDFARQVLKRIPLVKQQLTILRTLYKAHPARVSSADLAASVSYRHQQFVGLMGAFGRRVVNTPGWVENSWFFDQEWDAEAGSNTYTLPESVMEALRFEKLV